MQLNFFWSCTLTDMSFVSEMKSFVFTCFDNVKWGQVKQSLKIPRASLMEPLLVALYKSQGWKQSSLKKSISLTSKWEAIDLYMYSPRKIADAFKREKTFALQSCELCKGGRMLKVKGKPEENGMQEVKAVHMVHRQLFAPYDRSKGNFRAVCTICGAYQRCRSGCFNVISHKKNW